MSRPPPWARRLRVPVWLAALLLAPTPAYADNCSALSDCYGQILAAVVVALVIAALVILAVELAAAGAAAAAVAEAEAAAAAAAEAEAAAAAEAEAAAAAAEAEAAAAAEAEAAEAAEAAAQAERMEAVREAGRAGEEAVGLVKNTTRIPSATNPGTYRIPDGLDQAARVLSEVKNVARQGLTSQLRDFLAYAQANGYRFDLWVRPTTQLSGPLRDAIVQGLINLRIIP